MYDDKCFGEVLNPYIGMVGLTVSTFAAGLLMYKYGGEVKNSVDVFDDMGTSIEDTSNDWIDTTYY